MLGTTMALTGFSEDVWHATEECPVTFCLWNISSGVKLIWISQHFESVIFSLLGIKNSAAEGANLRLW